MGETNNFRDGYLDRDSSFGSISSVVQLVTDGQSLVLDDYQGLLRLLSDNTTATNRTFTISSGVAEGQRLIIILESGGSTACELLSSGNVKLSSTWAPNTQWSALFLVWNGTYWIEANRLGDGSLVEGTAVPDASVPSPVASAQTNSYVQATINAGFDAKADQAALLDLQDTVNGLLASLRAANLIAT
jgi:hypothetical protein